MGCVHLTVGLRHPLERGAQGNDRRIQTKADKILFLEADEFCLEAWHVRFLHSHKLEPEGVFPGNPLLVEVLCHPTLAWITPKSRSLKSPTGNRWANTTE